MKCLPFFFFYLLALFLVLFHPATGITGEGCPGSLERSLLPIPTFSPTYSTTDDAPDKTYLKAYEKQLTEWASSTFWDFSVETINACAKKKYNGSESNSRQFNFWAKGNDKKRFLMIDKDGNFSIFLMLKNGPAMGANYLFEDNPRNAGGDYLIEQASLNGKTLLITIVQNQSSDNVCDIVESYSLDEKTMKISPFMLFQAQGKAKSRVFSCESIGTMNTFPIQEPKPQVFVKGKPVTRFFVYEDRCDRFDDKCNKPFKETYTWKGDIFVSDRKKSPPKK